MSSGSGYLTKRRLWTVVVVLYVGFMFHNSMTPAAESSRQSGGVLEMVLAAAQVLGMESGWITEYLIRKTAHVAEYCLFGILLGTAVRQYSLETRFRRLWQCWISAMVPLADETVQLFVEGRSGQVSDVWLDMAGAAAGSLALGIWLWMRNRRKLSCARQGTHHQK